ncbi:hypothetical protein E2562_023372 [Oryza meyeriana var. granulata]|uniref:Pentacotripeptide-repeat region of PRORP domain-containing protein n=1 Tax=Oryza meyeriana var. granulata TaxID=110450 RepID=A0A6G1E0S6_9ORYZ|nr:hypothetical protein E2562_023372 [Oryza meyeriana var. granulata]
MSASEPRSSGPTRRPFRAAPNVARSAAGRPSTHGCSGPGCSRTRSCTTRCSTCTTSAAAHSVFDGMPHRDIAWTAMISAHTAVGDASSALELFAEMGEQGVVPNGFTLAAVLKASVVGSDLGFTPQVHAQAVKLQGLLDPYVASSLVEAYGGASRAARPSNRASSSLLSAAAYTAHSHPSGIVSKDDVMRDNCDVDSGSNDTDLAAAAGSVVATGDFA